MIHKGHSLTLLLVILLAAFLLAFFPASHALAQSETPPPDSRCRTCHENLYFLHDSGQWCCFCERERPCTCCHGGNPETADEDLAHEGLVANPIAENPALCQNCHPDDYQERIQRFSHAAGIEATPRLTPTGTPHAPSLAASTGGGPPSPMLEPSPMPAWQVAALGLLGGAFLALAVFSYRCWRADCLAKILNLQE